MSGGGQLRKEMEARVKAGLAERGLRRQRAKERYRRTEGVEPPLEAQLLVSVSADRYGLVRLAGAAEIVCDAVDDAYETAPEDALSRGQKIYRDRRMHPLASIGFKQLAPGAVQYVPFEWTASDGEQGMRAVDDFFVFVDGPVGQWLEERSSISGVLAGVDRADHGGLRPEIARNAAVLDVLTGRRQAARDRVQRYAQAPDDRSDGPEQLQAFLRWLEELEPHPDLLGSSRHPPGG